MEETQSEFGRGITYCLGLFLCHVPGGATYDSIAFSEFEPGSDDELKQKLLYSSWFYGAADHLYEIDTEGCSDEINSKIEELREFAFSKRRGIGTKEDVFKCKRMALDILMKIDEDILKTDVQRGDWE